MKEEEDVADSQISKLKTEFHLFGETLKVTRRLI